MWSSNFLPRLSRVTAIALLTLSAGCIHVHTDADGKVKSVEVKRPESAASAKPPAPPDGGVRQAGATVPAPVTMPVAPKAMTAPAPGQAVSIGVMWQKRLAFLPDPTKNGVPGVGIVGQMLLFADGPKMPFATADGSLTVVMFDESSGRAADAPLGTWTFDKETLRKLVTLDERVGKCYALFLPWPDYKPSVSKVRLTVKYEAERGYPLFAEPASVAIEPPGGVGMSAGGFTMSPGMGAAPAAGFAPGPMPGGGMSAGGPPFPPTAPGSFAAPAASPSPLAGPGMNPAFLPSGPGGAMTPGGLPPIVMTAGAGR